LKLEGEKKPINEKEWLDVVGIKSDTEGNNYIMVSPWEKI